MSTESQRFSLSTVLAVSAVVGAGAFAAGRSMHSDGAPPSTISSEPPITTATSMTTPTSTSTTPALPQGHPPVEGNGATPPPLAQAPSAESTIAWKVPAKWQVVPNASTMRLATYRVGADAEMAVSQAGGAIDANVERWIAQFGPEAKKNSKVTTKKVAGLDVTIVEVEGNYGGSMGAGAKEGWALLGAIVATPGMPHFFKLLGPAKTVKAARPELDELVSSITPK